MYCVSFVKSFAVGGGGVGGTRHCGFEERACEKNASHPMYCIMREILCYRGGGKRHFGCERGDSKKYFRTKIISRVK